MHRKFWWSLNTWLVGSDRQADMPVAILRLSLAGGVMKVVTTANELLTVDVSYIGLHGVGCSLIPPQSPRPSYYTRPPYQLLSVRSASAS